ncbi:MAG TPA: acetyl-CoA C-acetyltransferase [Gammaproteobacteria bacterium]|nr:acetyl-CoA C-acetyltransferase [Gammaproteobacteria bacterium]
MNQTTRRVAIVGGQRIPFARAHSAYAEASNQDMMTAALKALVDKTGIAGERLGDVGLGAVIKNSRDFNLARESVLGCGLDPHTPAFDVQRACGTSLEAAIMIGNKIATGQIESGIAGGVDSISGVPLVFSDKFRNIAMQSMRGKSMGDKLKPWLKLRPKDLKPQAPGVVEPRTHLSMGQHCELMAKEWKIPRAEQDELALASHKKAAAAWDSGFYDDLVTSYRGLERDNNVRGDSSLEKLSTLKPAFDRENGTLTAGNSTPLTDGAAAVLLCSEEWAKAHKLEPIAYLTYGEVAAVDYVGKKEGLLMAPAYAVPRMLERAGITLQDFDLYEIHEAFAAQVLCTLKAWEDDTFCKERLGLDKALGSIDRKKLNLEGGSVALGHPFAATGARIIATLAKELQTKKANRGLISVCTAGGMGVTAILERA